MAMRPNYRQNRMNRERAKAAKRAEKAEAKAAAKAKKTVEPDGKETEGSDPLRIARHLMGPRRD